MSPGDLGGPVGAEAESGPIGLLFGVEPGGGQTCGERSMAWNWA
jgi:hypothetical protein